MFKRKETKIMWTRATTNCYVEKAKMLSLPYEEQHGLLPMLGDYLTTDIATEWMKEDIPCLDRLHIKGLVSEKAARLYRKIDENFDETSFGSPGYEEIIWTLEGLKDHPFWKKQRELAKELLEELEKINVDSIDL